MVKSRCALSRSVATSNVYLVAASTLGNGGDAGDAAAGPGREMTETALTHAWAASRESC